MDVMRWAREGGGGEGQAYSRKEARIQQECSGKPTISLGHDSQFSKEDLNRTPSQRK